MEPWPNYYRYAQALSLLHYYVLASLARRPLYAYAISQQVTHDSQGSLVPARTSVKRAVETLYHWGLITQDRAASYQDSRRGATYMLTNAGCHRLRQEIAHLGRAVRIGNAGLKHCGLRSASAVTPDPT